MATRKNQVKARLQAQLPDMLALIEALVNIDSGSYHKAGVDQVSSKLAARLSQLGFDIERENNAAHGDLVIATKTLGGQGRLLILGHADTVWPKGTVEAWPYSRVDDNHATGPGVGDMKGGLVMALFALQELFRDGFSALESIRFVIVPDEEIGSVNSREAIEKQVKQTDYTLVLEPGRPGGGIVTARGALGAFFMHAHGCSAHCAVNYRKGASAIKELSYKIPELEKLSSPDEGSIINVGVFNGGVARQVVPGSARIDIDMRARTQANAEALRNKLSHIAKTRRDPRVSTELSGGFTRPAFTSELNRQLSRIASDVAAKLELDIFEVEPTGGGSDGNFSAALGVPTLDGLGPVCHDICSRQETIEIATLPERGALFYGIIQQLPTLNVKGK